MGAPASKKEKMSDNDTLALHYRNCNKVYDIMHPYLVGSLISWPAFWLYQGLRWQKRSDCLPKYIRETYRKSKLMTLGLLSAGVVAVALDKQNEAEKARKEAESKKKKGRK